MTEKRFFEIVGEAQFYTFARVRDGVSLSTANAMIIEQRDWADEESSKGVDFSQAPYWLTTDDGQDPIPVSSLDDINDALREQREY